MKTKSSKDGDDVRDGNDKTWKTPLAARIAALREDHGGTTAHAMAQGRFTRASYPLGAAAVLLRQEQCRPAPGFNRANLELTPEFQENVKAHGVLVPILVRPLERPDGAVTHEIVAGVRRWKANGMAGHDTLPARSFLLDDAQVRQLRLIENLQRTGLTPLDEARQFQEAVQGGVTVEQLALQVGLKRTAVYDRLRLLDAAPVVQQAVSEGKLEASVGSLLAQIPDAKQQAEAFKDVIEDCEGNPMPFRDARAHIRDEYCRSLKGAPFHLEKLYDGSIEGRTGPGSTLAGVGSCALCPRRSGNIPGFGGEPNVCTDPPCYQAKVRAVGAERLEAAAQSGQEVHGPAEAGKFFRAGSAHLKDGNYVAVTDRCDKLDWQNDKSWKAVLGPDAPPVILAADANGAVRELYARAAAETALKVAAKAGRVKLQESRASSGRSSSSDAAQKVREKKAKAMKLGARTAVAAVLEKLVGTVGTVKRPSVATLHSALWPLLAQAAFDNSLIDVREFVAKRRGLAETMTTAHDGIRKWLKGRTDVFELARFVVECLVLAPGARGGAYYEPEWEPGLAAAAKLAGVALKAEEPKPKAQSAKLKAQEKSQAPGPKAKTKKAQSKKRK